MIGKSIWKREGIHEIVMYKSSKPLIKKLDQWRRFDLPQVFSHRLSLLICPDLYTTKTIDRPSTGESVSYNVVKNRTIWNGEIYRSNTCKWGRKVQVQIATGCMFKIMIYEEKDNMYNEITNSFPRHDYVAPKLINTPDLLDIGFAGIKHPGLIFKANK